MPVKFVTSEPKDGLFNLSAAVPPLLPPEGLSSRCAATAIRSRCSSSVESFPPLKLSASFCSLQQQQWQTPAHRLGLAHAWFGAKSCHKLVSLLKGFCIGGDLLLGVTDPYVQLSTAAALTRRTALRVKGEGAPEDAHCVLKLLQHRWVVDVSQRLLHAPQNHTPQRPMAASGCDVTCLAASYLKRATKLAS